MKNKNLQNYGKSDFTLKQLWCTYCNVTNTIIIMTHRLQIDMMSKKMGNTDLLLFVFSSNNY